MFRQLLRWAASWLLLACLLLSSSAGVVLCLGDGHLAIEPGDHHHGDCGPVHDDAGQEHSRGPWSDAPAPACATCECVDVSLGCDIFAHSGKSLMQKHRLQHHANPWSAMRWSVPSQIDHHRWRRSLAGTADVPAQVLLEQQTIVLLV